MGWKCHNNIRPGVIFKVPVLAAIKKCKGVWQQWKREINQSLSNCTEWKNSTTKAIAGLYEGIYYLFHFYTYFIKIVMEIEFLKT